MRLNLNDLVIKTLKPADKQVDYFCTQQRGFGIRVSPAGTKTFFLLAGSPKRRHNLVHYPNVRLTDARKAAATIKIAPEPTLARTLLQDALDTYYSTYILPNYRERSAANAQRLLSKHTAALPRYLTEITTHDCIKVLDALAHTPSEANHFFGVLKTFFNWCEQRQLVTRSPIATLSKPAREKSRDRTLSNDELSAIWNASAAHTQFNTIVRLCILTGQRRGEIARIQPTWLNGEVLTIPKSVAKNNMEHSIPLTPYTLHLIQTTPLGAYNSWSQPKRSLDARIDIPHWTLHDLRRTFATIHAQIGTPPHITERLLNHLTGTMTPIARIYNRYTYESEMRTALTAYENHLRTFLLFP
jgi:integrase